MSDRSNTFPKLHNAAWPGVVGKGSPDAEPFISLDTMLDLTAAAEVDGQKFDGVDLFLFDPHVNIDSTDDDLQELAEKVQSRGLVIGTVVAPIWGPTGGGSALGDATEVEKFLGQVRKGCRIARKLRELGVRPYGAVRLDTACGVEPFAADPKGGMARLIDTFDKACDIAADHGEQLTAEGEICWGGMHSWRYMLDLLEGVNRPDVLGFQADMAHTLLFLLGYNAPEHALLPCDFDFQDQAAFHDAYKKLTDALRPWTIDLHIAQNDATVHGSGTHDKTGRHCLATDPNGKLDIVQCAGYWLRDERGEVTRKTTHICWDGCMFPNVVMMEPDTWNDILRVMIAVRAAHGWG